MRIGGEEGEGELGGERLGVNRVINRIPSIYLSGNGITVESVQLKQCYSHRKGEAEIAGRREKGNRD